ncbi:DUF4236 domain-containing protein [Mucilaginibacter aquatilis]|uniref:DUF4236 domain-containing protein n=1 Tax=Mucilaginibacter aquatilis TaxID=1517760 RepID=A0A6I4IPS4_9SPHI|nr:DUF4236 domain-containing protein [Mucilaginibacter aquatilis]MVN90523.1 DUF4236 domain-containing protein [Mucilaginibacter aquatilis]
MSWSYRKSFGAGPFRINFSKSGISYSVGVQGARVNFGHKGTYVNLNSHGISYRRKISSQHSSGYVPSTELMLDSSNDVHHISSAAIEQLTDTDSGNFIAELEQKAKLISYARWFGYFPMFILLVGLLFTSFSTQSVTTQPRTDSTFVRITSPVGVYIRKAPTAKSTVLRSATSDERFQLADSAKHKWLKVIVNGSTGYIGSRFAEVEHVHYDEVIKTHTTFSDLYIGYELVGITVIFTILIIWLKKKDRERFETELHYDMDEKFKNLYNQFSSHFATLSNSARIWQYLNKQHTSDLKRNAGASQLIKRTLIRGISSNRAPLPYFVTNVAIPSIKLNNLELYFLPERLLVKRGNIFAAVFYKNIKIEGYSSRFIEDESVPRDAQIVDHTWRYVNKRGGPDRRFNNNRQIPICAYSQYEITSNTGIYEVLTTSKQGAMDAFAGFLMQIGNLQSKMIIS